MKNKAKTGLGACIYSWRKANGLTQEQLSEALGTSKGHLSDMENGNKPTSSKWLDKISTAYGVTLAEILEAGGQLDAAAASPTSVLDQFLGLTDEAQADILSLMRHMPKRPAQE